MRRIYFGVEMELKVRYFFELSFCFRFEEDLFLFILVLDLKVIEFIKYWFSGKFWVG